MFQLVNNTNYKVERAILMDFNAKKIWVVVIKATYVLNEDGSLDFSKDQESVCCAPIFLNEENPCGLLRDCELVPVHPGTDVTLNAVAYVPNGELSSCFDAEVRVGPVNKTLRIFGDRRWVKTKKKGVVFTSPEQIEKIPITWDKAFGGTRVKDRYSDSDQFDERNPVGRGFAVHPDQLDDELLPNIEDPADLIAQGGNAVRPTGLCSVPYHWLPRKKYAGTYDDSWIKNRMPLWPQDSDPRFYQSAPRGLTSAQPFRGGERVILTNLSRSGHITFRLPRLLVTVDTFLPGSRIEQTVQLDRVIIEPELKKLVMVWRASLNCGVHIRQVEKTLVDIKRKIRLS